MKLWDLTDGKLLHDFKCNEGQIQCIDFHPHEFLLATGSADGTVKFWDLETFELIGSAGPETTGVRYLTFSLDGRALLCGLHESLKVFSWELIRCHDVVDVGWSRLSDLNVHEGKLLGCSYNQTCVGVWVVDISCIEPYSISNASRLKGHSESKPLSGGNLSVFNKNAARSSLGRFSVSQSSDSLVKETKSPGTLALTLVVVENKKGVNDVTKALVELMNESKQEVPNWLNDYAEQSLSYGGDQSQMYGSSNFGGYNFCGSDNYSYCDTSYNGGKGNAPGTAGSLSFGNYCSSVSSALYFPNFMITFIEFGFVAIDVGALALVPQIHFSVHMWSNEALLLILLSAIMHSQTTEFVISSNLLQSPNREALMVFSNMQNVYHRQSNFNFHVSVHLCTMDNESELVLYTAMFNFHHWFCIVLVRAFARSEVLLNHVLESSGLHEWLARAIEIGNPNALLLALKMGEKVYVASTRFGKLLADLSSLANSLMDTAFCQPRIHNVWLVQLHILLLDGFLQAEDALTIANPLKKHKKNRKSSSPDDFEVDDHLFDFYKIFIEPLIACYLRYIDKQPSYGRYEDSPVTVSSTIMNGEKYMFATIDNLCTALVFQCCLIGRVEVPEKWFMNVMNMNLETMVGKVRCGREKELHVNLFKIHREPLEKCVGYALSTLNASCSRVQKLFLVDWAFANVPISWKDVETKLFALNVVTKVLLQEGQILDFSVIMQLVMILSTRPLDKLKGTMCINVHSSLGDVDDSYSKCISVFQTIARPLLLFLAATLLLNNVERDENLIAALASSLGKDCSGCIKNGELDQSCKKIYLCHEQFKALVRSNFYICKWFGLSVICVQGLTLLLAIILKALGLCHYYDSDDDYILERVSLLNYSPHGVFSITTDGSKNDAWHVLMIIFGDYLWTMSDQPKDNILIGDIELPGVLAIFISALVLGGTNDQLFWYYKSKIMKYLKELAKVFDIKSQMETLVDYRVRPPQKKICSSFVVDFILLPFTSSFCSLHLQLDAKRAKTSQHSPTLYRIAEIRVKNLKVLAIEKYLRDAIESWLDGILGESGSCEIKWGGNFTKQGSLDYGADFGFGLYIDHHYYLGYFLYGISVLAKIELEWEMRYKPQVDSLAAGSMNLDKRTGFHYSLVRCFDLYKLHSWVGGVTYKETMQDGYEISKFRFEIVAFCLSSRLFLKLEVKFQLKRGGVVRTQFYDLQAQVCIEAHNSSFGCESP